MPSTQDRTAIVVAIITVLGTLGAALLANWDKVIPESPAKPKSAVSAEASNPPVAPTFSTNTNSAPSLSAVPSLVTPPRSSDAKGPLARTSAPPARASNASPWQPAASKDALIAGSRPILGVHFLIAAGEKEEATLSPGDSTAVEVVARNYVGRGERILVLCSRKGPDQSDRLEASTRLLRMAAILEKNGIDSRRINAFYAPHDDYSDPGLCVLASTMETMP